MYGDLRRNLAESTLGGKFADRAARAHVVSAFRAVASTSPESTRVPGMLRQVLLVVGISASLIALNVVLQNRPAGRHAASSPGAPLASHAGAGADAAEVTQLRQELRERNKQRAVR